MIFGSADSDNNEELESPVKSINEAQSFMIQILNFALNEHQSSKLVQRSFDAHKNCEIAQESHLQPGDRVDVMTNTLTYDLDPSSAQMIARSLSKNVRYVYYLEKTEVTSKAVIKFLNQFMRYLADACGKEEATAILERNLGLYWLPANQFPYSFVIIDRPSEATPDHCAFYFLRDGKKCKYIYETRLENAQNEVAILSKIFKWFRCTFEKIDVRSIVNQYHDE